MLDSVDAQDQLSKKIDKTGIALEMAKTNMNTHEERLKRMNAAIEDSKIAFFEATGGMTAYLGPVAQVATTVNSLTPIYTASKLAVLALATAKGRDALMTNLKSKAEWVSATAGKAAAAAQWLWNTAMNASPIGLAITGIAALGTVLYATSKAFGSSTAAERMNAEVKSRVIEKTIDERIELDSLFDKLRNSKKGTDEYKNALVELDNKYPGILEKYDLQKGKIDNINLAYKDLLSNIEKQATLEAAKEILKEKKKQYLIDKQNGPTFTDQISSTLSWGNSTYDIEMRNAPAEMKRLVKMIGKLEKGTKKPTSNSMINPAPTDTPPLATIAGYTPPPTTKENKVIGGAGDVKRIDVRIENLMKGDIVLNSSTIKESAVEIKRMITEALVGAVKDFEVAI
ncbi:MAG: hypothetical protein EBQ94_00310 [Flavobacteriales bacterium]|nr:hypothetical protein [Flavobacteriales bacterium]